MPLENSTVVVNRRFTNDYDIYIGRPSKWGNPFSHIHVGTLAQYRVATRQDAIEAYAQWIRTQPHLLAALPELKNKRLGCWCAPKPCHGYVLVNLVEELVTARS